MYIYWLFIATLLCSIVGYRLAVRYRLSGITGLVIALSFCVMFATNLWRLTLTWLMTGDQLVTASATLLTVATLFAFVEKYKFVAIVKVTSMLFPVSFASVNLPVVAVSVSERQTAATVLSFSDFRDRLTREPSTADPDSARPEESKGLFRKARPLYAKVSSKSVLFNLNNGGLLKSTTVVKKGTWVRTGRQLIEPSGRRWIKVILPDRFGEHNPETGESGYVPIDNISERISLAT